MSGTSFLMTVFSIGTFVLLPFYLYELSCKGGIEMSISNTAAILYLGLGASVICFLLWNISIANLGAGRASLFGNLIPVFSSIEAVLILGESIAWVHIAGFALVSTGLLIANVQKRNKSIN